jgi:hypothetical protein
MKPHVMPLAEENYMQRFCIIGVMPINPVIATANYARAKSQVTFLVGDTD